MNVAQKVKQFITEDTSYYIASTRQFLEFDLNKLSEKLKLKERAGERAKAEQPDSSAQELDSVETEIVSIIHAERTRNFHTLQAELSACDARIASSSLENRAHEIKDEARNAISEFEAEVRDGVNQLAYDLQKVKEIHSERNEFRKENNLNRTASHPESRLLGISFLMFLALTEIILNGSFLAVNNEMGLLGGIFEAVAITVINVLAGVLFGSLAYPKLWHVRRFVKIQGWILFLIHAVIVFSFNLLVAHYRIALMGADPAAAPTVAMQTIFASPISILDFKAWMLFAVGSIYAFLSAFDAFKMNDRYPGFSALERRYSATLHRYAEHQTYVIDRLRAIKDRSISKIQELNDSVPNKTTEYQSALASRESLLGSFAERQTYLASCLSNLLTIYRDENRLVRKTPVPQYFNQAVSLPTMAEFNTTPPAGINITLIEEAKKEAGLVSEQMYTKFVDVQNKFPLLNDLIFET